MILDVESTESILLSLKLASIVSISLLSLATLLAWYLYRSKSRLKVVIESMISLPIILPPTVVGFYLLLAMGPNGPIGYLSKILNITPLPFTFWGVVVASIFYSLPYVVRPIQSSFEAMGNRPLEVAATLGATPLDQFFSVAIPQAKAGIMSAFIIGFAHTIGQFGIILMIGGNIPKETKVVSIQIFEFVETLNYQAAHKLSAIMLIFSFLILLILHFLNSKSQKKFY